MPPKQKVSISPGDRFGMLTVISECGRNKHGHLQYLVRCDCNKEYVVNRNFLFRRILNAQNVQKNYSKEEETGSIRFGVLSTTGFCYLKKGKIPKVGFCMKLLVCNVETVL